MKSKRTVKHYKKKIPTLHPNDAGILMWFARFDDLILPGDKKFYDIRERTRERDRMFDLLSPEGKKIAEAMEFTAEQLTTALMLKKQEWVKSKKKSVVVE